jgi:hypothetical protein
MMGSARLLRSYGLTHGSMEEQPAATMNAEEINAATTAFLIMSLDLL